MEGWYTNALFSVINVLRITINIWKKNHFLNNFFVLFQSYRIMKILENLLNWINKQLNENYLYILESDILALFICNLSMRLMYILPLDCFVINSGTMIFDASCHSMGASEFKLLKYSLMNRVRNFNYSFFVVVKTVTLDILT